MRRCPRKTSYLHLTFFQEVSKMINFDLKSDAECCFSYKNASNCFQYNLTELGPFIHVQLNHNNFDVHVLNVFCNYWPVIVTNYWFSTCVRNDCRHVSISPCQPFYNFSTTPAQYHPCHPISMSTPRMPELCSYFQGTFFYKQHSP